jgi:chromosomal replication initiation ATPase DnaA
MKLATETPAAPDQPAERPAVKPSWRPIWSEVARQTGIPAEQLNKGDAGRSMPITAYRQLTMALTCRLTSLSLNTIARLFSINDHSTVIHARTAAIGKPVLDETVLSALTKIRHSDWKE